jgi:CubicO group peptidase (beta-lactamase class C family)
LKPTTKIVTLILLVFASTNSSSQTVKKELRHSNDELLKLLTKSFPEGTQLSIALVNDTLVDYWGVKKQMDSLIYVDNKDSIFEIGSITKIFTSCLLADFVCNRIVELDAPIDNRFPYPLHRYSKSGKQITFKTLANHTSGLTRDPINYDFSKYPDNHFAGYSYALLDDYLKRMVEIYSEPGEIYEYSNLGYGILGYILENISSKTFEELLQEKVFGKYAMTSTSSDRGKIKNRIIAGQDANGKKTPNWDMNSMVAAGGVLSNAVDLSKFAIANFSNDSILKLQRKTTFKTEYKTVALGWDEFKFGDVEAISGFLHGGGTGGYSSIFVLDVNNKLAVIILTNVSAFFPGNEKISILGFELLRNLYNKTHTGK